MSAKIATALHEVMQKVGYVQKTGKNAFHGYKYAGEADLLEKLRPAMIDAGLLLLPSGVNHTEIDAHGNIHVAVEYTLAHKDGDIWPHKLVAFGAGNDRNKNGVGDKGLYKALTGANKYLLFKLFQIETGDDPEATEAAPQSAAIDTERMAYMTLALGVIRNFKTSAADMKAWWEDEKPKRETVGIVNGTPEYSELFTAFKDKGLSLASNANIEGRAA